MCEVLRNTYSEEHLRMAASIFFVKNEVFIRRLCSYSHSLMKALKTRFILCTATGPERFSFWLENGKVQKVIGYNRNPDVGYCELLVVLSRIFVLSATVLKLFYFFTLSVDIGAKYFNIPLWYQNGNNSALKRRILLVISCLGFSVHWFILKLFRETDFMG